MSLDAFLGKGTPMLPDDRMKLAINLAAFILQYNLTPRLLKCWTSKTIHLVLQPQATSGIDVDHPLILKQLDSHDRNGRQELPEDNPELALMELGILLLELWTMKTLERWLKDMEYALDASQLEDRDFRHIYAMMWFRSMREKLLPDYYEVISTCLTPTTFHQLETSWEDADFRANVYKTIVEPLLIWNDQNSTEALDDLVRRAVQDWSTVLIMPYCAPVLFKFEMDLGHGGSNFSLISFVTDCKSLLC